MLKIFASALMMRFLPNLCNIECIWDNLNGTNNPQKSKFQDKGGEETKKVKENISENLAGNKTAVEIRAKNVIIKWGVGGGERERERKMKGRSGWKKKQKQKEKREQSERKIERKCV